jgi:Ca2+-binding RTX toxin-like protein
MHFQTLELRRFLSVTVVQDYPGYYEVNGDSTDDNIAITVSTNDATFSVDGNTYTDVSYIMVNGGPGNDTISINSIDGPDGVGAAVSGGAGNDSITTNLDASVWAGEGDDTIRVADSFQGQVYGQGGDDQIYASGRCIDAILDGGDGNDLIDATQNDFGVQASGGNGNDTILGSQYDDVIDGGNGSDSLAGNGGNDVIYSRAGNGDSVDGGDGNNIVYANGSEAGIDNAQTIYYS